MNEPIKNVVVIGGAGFVGSHLCKRLASSGDCHVTSLDNYFTGSTKNHISGVDYIRGSSSQIESLLGTVPDIVYHLGEYSRVEKSFDDIETVLQFNTLGTFHVLEYVRKYNCKLVYAGSSTKFEQTSNGLHSSPYSWSKASNTQLVSNYGAWFGINYAITYFYNVYGPGEIEAGEYATLIAIFKKQMREGQELTVVSPGTQRRNFTHIDDIISGLLLVGEHGKGDEYGIGCPQSYSVIEVAQLFSGKITYLPARRGNRSDAPLISSKMQELSWKATRNLEHYILESSENGWR